MSKIFDLAIMWDWEYDQYFINRIEEILQGTGFSTYRVHYYNIEETVYNLKKNHIKFNCFFDRTGDDSFNPLYKYIKKQNQRLINHYDKIWNANDKATMHLDFITGGINVPYSIIISPYNSNIDIELSLSELACLGRPFIIKPANNTGGGLGVVTGAETLYDILETRKHLKDDKYLIQQKIIPRIIDNRRAWFRCFYAFNRPVLCWWDDLTHRYEIVTEYQENEFRLVKLRKIMSSVHKICGLDFFSSEIAITEENKFVVVDYVNETCDMRPQSLCFDGVPDSVIDEIILRLASFIKKEIKNV